MDENIQHGNYAKINPNKKIEPVYKTLTITSKTTNNEKNEVPVTAFSLDNVIEAKKAVDENHK